jgi:hypothetical protein
MLDRFKRRISRTKSVPQPEEPKENEFVTRARTLTLTPSDEHLVSKLSFSPDTRLDNRAPALKAPSVTTRASERTVSNNVDSGFLSLPTEILVFLQPYLTESSEVALRHSCSRFFHLYSTPSFYLKGNDLFEFLCMTERDQDPTQLEKLVCGVCQRLHPRISFPSAEVRQPPLQRDCRQIWLCAHKFLGYQRSAKTIKAGVDAPFRSENIEPCSRCRETIRNRSVADRPEKGTSFIDIENPKSESLLISKIGLMQAPAPTYNMRGASGSSGFFREVFQARDVSAALQAIDFRLCSHLKLGDPFILSKFCRSCINTQKLPPGVKGPTCISEPDKKDFGKAKTIGRCKGSCYIRGCKTQFMFQARESLAPDSSGRRQIWLIIVVYRWLGPLLSIGRDSTWVDHSSVFKERLEMKHKWTTWEREKRGQQCMPNWSIALLHPDDSNLR